MEFTSEILVGSQTDTVYEFVSTCGVYRYHKVRNDRGVHYKVSRLTVTGDWVLLKKAKSRNKAEMACIVNKWKRKSRENNV